MASLVFLTPLLLQTASATPADAAAGAGSPIEAGAPPAGSPQMELGIEEPDWKARKPSSPT